MAFINLLLEALFILVNAIGERIMVLNNKKVRKKEPSVMKHQESYHKNLIWEFNLYQIKLSLIASRARFLDRTLRGCVKRWLNLTEAGSNIDPTVRKRKTEYGVGGNKRGRIDCAEITYHGICRFNFSPRRKGFVSCAGQSRPLFPPLLQL